MHLLLRLPRAVPALLAGAAFAFAAEPAPDADESAPPSPEQAGEHDHPLSPKEAAIEKLLEQHESLQAFERVAALAREQGVPDQMLLEARFLFHVDHRNDAEIVALLPEFLKRRDSFQPQDSAIFAVKEDWLAVIEYAQALEALAKGDKTAFKRHITEAFWLSPGQGAAFAPHIERLHLEEAMRDLRLDFQAELAGLLAPAPTKLDSLVAGERKALVLHFWSPWARECEETMNDFAATARVLEQHGVSVASVLAEDDPEILADARKLVGSLPGGTPCQWLLDRKKQPLAALFRVQDLPTVVLVKPDGQVLFNGHPSDERLWQQLRALDPQLERPRLDKPAQP